VCYTKTPLSRMNVQKHPDFTKACTTKKDHLKGMGRAPEKPMVPSNKSDYWEAFPREWASTNDKDGEREQGNRCDLKFE